MQAKNNSLKTPIQYFKGVGPKRAADLARLGIETAEDMLFYMPSRYEDRSNFAAIKDLKPGDQKAVRGRIVALGQRTARSGTSIFHAAVSDGTGAIIASWFNQPYLKDYFRRGQKVALFGKAEVYDSLQMVQPEYEILKDGDSGESVNMGRIVPIYRATAELNQKYLRNLAFEASSSFYKFVREDIPAYLLARNKLVDIKFAVRNIHFPSNFTSLEKAYRRIVFGEFLLLQMALAVMKRGMRETSSGLRHRVRGAITKRLKDSLPFELTEGQKKAISDVERDMASSRPMNRLLEGDVGSGKTMVAAHAAAVTVQNGFQAAIMAPTEVLARQHFMNLGELLIPLSVNIAFLAGGMAAKSKKRICEELASGAIDIVVGTHAVIQEGIEFKKLGLAVVDEQHKFGVTQRAVLKQKGHSPHILVMTATPIPRTLALTVYGDLDISVIRELPRGRIPIVTYWVEEEKRPEAYDFIKEELAKGRQAYVVCPLIDSPAESSKLKAQSAIDMFERLRKEEFGNYEVGLLHGRMSSAEKDRVMRDFKKGRTAILVSTIVVEVGIDVPNATVMLIENAERFGLAQLHQLRGRVGRGVHESYCILLGDPKNEEAVKRLKAIEGTVDGFEIAEADLGLRGPGEFFGTRQHGLPEIRFGNILKDFDIMESARREAFELVAKDPSFLEERHRPLKALLAARFKTCANLSHVA